MFLKQEKTQVLIDLLRIAARDSLSQRKIHVFFGQQKNTRKSPRQ